MGPLPAPAATRLRGDQGGGVTAQLIVGPWLHGEHGETKAIARQDIAWLDHHLCGGPPPPGPPVRVFLQQAGQWLDFEEWPPRAAVETAYYLRAAGGLSPDAEPGDAAPDTFVYDPANPTPSLADPSSWRRASRSITPRSKPGLMS